MEKKLKNIRKIRKVYIHRDGNKHLIDKNGSLIAYDNKNKESTISGCNDNISHETNESYYDENLEDLNQDIDELDEQT